MAFAVKGILLVFEERTFLWISFRVSLSRSLTLSVSFFFPSVSLSLPFLSLLSFLLPSFVFHFLIFSFQLFSSLLLSPFPPSSVFSIFFSIQLSPLPLPCPLPSAPPLPSPSLPFLLLSSLLPTFLFSFLPSSPSSQTRAYIRLLTTSPSRSNSDNPIPLIS